MMDIRIDKYDLLTGFFVFVGLLGVACLTAFLAGPDLFDLGSVKIRTYLPRTYGLKRGVPVSFLELTVGHVKSVTLLEAGDPERRVEVVFTVKGKYREAIRKNFQTSLEAGTLGGIISGNVILNPPKEGASISPPVEDGDVLAYHTSASLVGDITQFTTHLQQEVLPKVDSILHEVDALLKFLNDPEGDVRRTVASFRGLSEYLADPEGAFRTGLARAIDMETTLADPNGPLMRTLTDEALFATLKETMENVRDLTRRTAALAETAEKALGNVDEVPASQRAILPAVLQILDNVLSMQAQLEKLLEDGRKIAAAAAQASGPLPGMMMDAQAQMKNLEDVMEAMKKLPILRWYVEGESTEDPVLLKPLLIQDAKLKSKDDEPASPKE